MAIHWFFSLGTAYKPTRYCLRTAQNQTDGDGERRFVSTALFELGYPVKQCRLGEVQLHLFATEQLNNAVENRHTGETGDSPLRVFREELNNVSEALLERFDGARSHALKAEQILSKRDADSIWSVVTRVLDTVEDGDEVVLESTNGLRSITLGFVLATGLLRQLRPKVKVLAVTYAEFDGGEDAQKRAISPVYDLLPFLELFEWAQAVRAMAKGLDPTPLLEMFEARPALTRPSRVMELELLQPALSLCAPREIAKLLHTWEDDDQAGASQMPELEPTGNPAADRALVHASELLAAVGVPPADCRVLDEGRLQFELALLHVLRDHGRLGDAIRLLREWLCNAAILANGWASDWLSRGVRLRGDATLWLASLASGKSRKELGRHFDRIAQDRNTVAHGAYHNAGLPNVDRLRARLNDCLNFIARCSRSEDGALEVFRSQATDFQVLVMAGGTVDALEAIFLTSGSERVVYFGSHEDVVEVRAWMETNWVQIQWCDKNIQ